MTLLLDAAFLVPRVRHGAASGRPFAPTRLRPPIRGCGCGSRAHGLPTASPTAGSDHEARAGWLGGPESRCGGAARIPDLPGGRAPARAAQADAALLDIVDHVLTKGVVVSGDIVLALADVDLVYLRLSALLCAADRLTGPRARR